MNIIYTCPECGHDLVDLILASNPPIPKKECWNCGWSWTGEREEVIRIPFGGNNFVTDTRNYLNVNGNDTITTTSTGNHLNNYNYETSLVSNFEQSACTNCPNNPKNGGSGICNCILNISKITC